VRTIADMRREAESQYRKPISLATFEPINAPKTFKVEGVAGGFIASWSQVTGAESYQIAVMTDNNRDTPNRGVFGVVGGQSNRFTYPFASVTRNFAVAAVRGGVVGPYTAIVAATSGAGVFTDTLTTTSVQDPATSSTGNEGSYDYGWGWPVPID